VHDVQVIDPATGAVVTEVAAADAAAVADAYRTAAAAQPAWAARPLTERVAILRRFRDAVEADGEELAATLTSETGKPISQARGELAAVLGRIDFFCDHVADTLADETVFDDPESGMRELLVHEPLGVVANISAWNYPWFVSTNVVVPALLAGNAVLFKPSELATLTGLAMVSRLHDAGVPVTVLVCLPGGPEVGAALLEQPVDGVFFTGSYATGRRIAETMAGRMVKVGLELGGKDPVYVTDDVDLDAAAESLASGAFYNNGQSCCAVERIYVHDAVHDAFVDRFVHEVRSYVQGDPTDDRTFLGPLTRPQQLGVLEAQVADAVEHGATLRLGGTPVDGPIGGTGAWFAPTVLTEVDDTMAVLRDESFGPVIGIARVAGDDEAVARMNDTDYGLTAGVYCRDEERARRLLARLDAGSAYWNCCDRVSPRLPWTGRHASGMGSTLGTEGILAFTQPKAYHLRRP
jgi:acyl-CoA reductase-like NAD-dependent aldehyde dehydrogenase